jgi:hypothetical protein
LGPASRHEHLASAPEFLDSFHPPLPPVASPLLQLSVKPEDLHQHTSSAVTISTLPAVSALGPLTTTLPPSSPSSLASVILPDGTYIEHNVHKGQKKSKLWSLGIKVLQNPVSLKAILLCGINGCTTTCPYDLKEKTTSTMVSYMFYAHVFSVCLIIVSFSIVFLGSCHVLCCMLHVFSFFRVADTCAIPPL